MALAVACGAGGGPQANAPSPTPAAVGWNGTVDDVAYVAFEKVSLERLARARLVAEGEVRLSQQVRRVTAYRLRDSELSAIRYTEDGSVGWLVWQPTVVLRARREFAREQAGTAAQIVTLGVTRAQWPNTCLGIVAAGSDCGSAATPGFRVVLRLGSVTATYHTDTGERALRAPG